MRLKFFIFVLTLFAPFAALSQGFQGGNAVGTTNQTAPTQAIEMGSLDGSGKLQAASASNPVPVSVLNAADIQIGTVDQGTPNNKANAWTAAITDGTNGPAAVKPASTAPAATDPALVVSLHPDGNTVQIAGLTYTNILTSTNTIVKASPGIFAGLAVNTAGTLSQAVVYDHATCTGTIIGTFSTVAQGSVPYNPGVAATTGICVTTTDTGGAADITVLWR